MYRQFNRNDGYKQGDWVCPPSQTEGTLRACSPSPCALIGSGPLGSSNHNRASEAVHRLTNNLLFYNSYYSFSIIFFFSFSFFFAAPLPVSCSSPPISDRAPCLPACK